jgi:hypothetical protein
MKIFSLRNHLKLKLKKRLFNNGEENTGNNVEVIENVKENSVGESTKEPADNEEEAVEENSVEEPHLNKIDDEKEAAAEAEENSIEENNTEEVGNNTEEAVEEVYEGEENTVVVPFDNEEAVEEVYEGEENTVVVPFDNEEHVYDIVVVPLNNEEKIYVVNSPYDAVVYDENLFSIHHEDLEDKISDEEENNEDATPFLSPEEDANN